MKKVLFYISDQVLSGQVACKYRLQTNIVGENALKLHFKHCSATKCAKKNCNCNHCDPELSVMPNDGYNVYLNKFSIETYFSLGPLTFWGIDTPHYILLDEDGIFLYEENAPAIAA
jgi:hypothetical protein